jgi:hypothetical protein
MPGMAGVGASNSASPAAGMPMFAVASAGNIGYAPGLMASANDASKGMCSSQQVSRFLSRSSFFLWSTGKNAPIPFGGDWANILVL